MQRSRVPSRLISFVAAAALASLVAAWSPAANAAPKTVCTVTINSADERDTFQRHLPRGDYQFVELVQRGNPEWLAAARKRGVRCDVLLISGHFDDGSEFYSDRFDERDFLTVHELQQASCSAAGQGLFAQLQEVYLFGCNTLKSDPRHTASAEVLRSLQRAGQSPAEADRVAALLSQRYGQSNRDRLRHVFNNVPLLYGFSSKAPLGRSAGPLLERYFQTAPAGEVGKGHASATLLKLFGPSSMIAVAGLTDADPHAGLRRDMCSLVDDGPARAQRVAAMHTLLRRDVTEVRMFLDHLERFAASIVAAERREPAVAAALDAIAADHETAGRFLEFSRDADDAAVQARMMALARDLGWLSGAQEQAEFVRMLADRMARGSLGKNEVDLVCASPHSREPGLADRLQATGAPQPANLAHSAVLACLGSPSAHERSIRALTGAHEEDSTIAQAYLRHRPLASVDELRALTAGIAGMGSGAGQVRALEALARQRLADAPSLHVVVGLFAQARTLGMQRAVVDILIRADTRLLDRAELARTLRQHRMKSPDGSDVIDMLIRMLQTT